MPTTGTVIPALSHPLAAAVMPAFSWDDVNPLRLLANVAAVGVTSIWQDVMTNLWSGGLWLTQVAFQLVDAFTSPDLAEGGLMSKIFPVTFGIGGALALVVAFLQVGFAAFQRDGRALGRLLVGLWQFMLAWGGMLGAGAALNVATSGLTQGMLRVALDAPSFAKVNILKPWQPRQAVDAAAATVLGLFGLLLFFAAIGYLLVMLVRAAALMILMATSPISAAGLLSEGTRAWFWKSLRWFLAALMIAPLAALVLGIAKLLTDGVLSGAGGSTEAAIGSAFIGTVLIVIGAFCPLILFRLLAFVDPGTSSGASFRTSLGAAGGIGGLLSGRDSAAVDGGGDSGAATSQAGNGGSQGEADASVATQSRLAASMGGLGAVAGGVSSAGQGAAAFSTDVLGAAGVGHPQPYFGGPGQNFQQPTQDKTSSSADAGSSGGADGGWSPASDTDPAPIPPAPPPAPTSAPGPAPGGKSGGGSGKTGAGPAGGAGGGGAGAGGVEAGAAAAAAV